jgi:hypothetical protein
MSRRVVLIESLEATPRDLARLLRPVAPEAALFRPAAGWCIAEVVAHLCYVEPLMGERLRRAVVEETPAVAPIEPGVHNIAQPVSELLAEFVERRNATIAMLRGLEQRNWGRTLSHPTHGTRRLRDEVQALVAHDNEHLAQIVGLRGQLADGASGAETVSC